jgi:hypothetical protein
MKKIITLLFSIALVSCSKETCATKGGVKCKGHECKCVELPEDVTPDGYVPACLPDGVSPDASSD